ncbi:unnamed protein product [Rhizophagus irregularis]|nr:unnamed protein product [Rhizophagus irregularis]
MKKVIGAPIINNPDFFKGQNFYRTCDYRKSKSVKSHTKKSNFRNVNPNEENVNNINNTNEDDLDFEENDSNTWTASGPMTNLPTEIYCGNSLEPAVKKKIFQAEPRNKDVSFTPLKMEQRMLSVMSCFDKETDRNYSKLLYKTSSVLRPIDNTLRMVYASKPKHHGLLFVFLRNSIADNNIKR